MNNLAPTVELILIREVYKDLLKSMVPEGLSMAWKLQIAWLIKVWQTKTTFIKMQVSIAHFL